MSDNAELLLRISKGDRLAKGLIIEKNMGLVYSVVNKLYSRGYEREDLVQIGAIGLLKAVEKFDLSYGVKFSTYAVPMVIGEIKRFLRDDGAIKVSRTLKEAALKGRRAEEILEKKLHRAPTISEISNECGIDSQTLVEAFDAVQPMQSLQAAASDDENLTLMGLVEGDCIEDEIVDRLCVKDLLSKINEREREIVLLRYFKGKTQSEIAEKFGVSQVQISRIEKKALIKMREVATL